ncbi:hypothetical protein C8J57DRAFT_1214799 [Mycena rebaudengoi]|nr:hypothetical protein C8J57DRAFT_1214799 [Mycena rebaudengoi]
MGHYELRRPPWSTTAYFHPLELGSRNKEIQPANKFMDGGGSKTIRRLLGLRLVNGKNEKKPACPSHAVRRDRTSDSREYRRANAWAEGNHHGPRQFCFYHLELGLYVRISCEWEKREKMELTTITACRREESNLRLPREYRRKRYYELRRPPWSTTACFHPLELGNRTSDSREYRRANTWAEGDHHGSRLRASILWNSGGSKNPTSRLTPSGGIEPPNPTGTTMRRTNELWGTTMVYDGLFSSFRTRVSVDEEVNEAADICYNDISTMTRPAIKPRKGKRGKCKKDMVYLRTPSGGIEPPTPASTESTYTNCGRPPWSTTAYFYPLELGKPRFHNSRRREESNLRFPRGILKEVSDFDDLRATAMVHDGLFSSFGTWVGVDEEVDEYE